MKQWRVMVPLDPERDLIYLVADGTYENSVYASHKLERELVEVGGWPYLEILTKTLEMVLRDFKEGK